MNILQRPFFDGSRLPIGISIIVDAVLSALAWALLVGFVVGLISIADLL